MAESQTEVEAYAHIRRQLKELGWDIRNPSLGTAGQVWTQTQCFGHPDIKTALGKTRPENIVKISENDLWVIESKASRKKLDIAISEAVEDYARPINDLGGKTRVVLATGIAGNEESGYAATTKIRLNGRWRLVTINGQEATGLLSPEDVRTLLTDRTHDVREFSPPQQLFLAAAERINGILHQGGINKNDRAKTIAALLLSVIKEPPNLDTALGVLIDEINARSKNVLAEHKKSEFAPFVRILPPTNQTNHVKFRFALVQTIQELLNLNIRSAMGSSTDVLGQFYEVFLKYGNGAKEIGIVLTPRHITRFAVEAVGVGTNDLVLDVACGTGGFLVAAFDHVRRNSTPKQLEKFKQYNLFGIEQESYIAVLAIVNMIFRGDGKNNITEGNCFSTTLAPAIIDGHATAAYGKAPSKGNEPITRVLMNPPFSSKGSVETEPKFVSRALTFMADGGILFSLLPMGSMFGSGDDRTWRTQELLGQNTLLAVISLPHELFYPAALKQVVGIVVRKGFPHPSDAPVFWGRIAVDGHIKVKSRRVSASELRPPRESPDDIPAILPLLQSFIANPSSTNVNKPLLCRTAPIDFTDPLLELLPEVYIESATPSTEQIERVVDRMARDTAAFLVRFGRENQVGLFDENH
jgi:type I restriction enzyme M protein